MNRNRTDDESIVDHQPSILLRSYRSITSHFECTSHRLPRLFAAAFVVVVKNMPMSGVSRELAAGRRCIERRRRRGRVVECTRAPSECAATRGPRKRGCRGWAGRRRSRRGSKAISRRAMVTGLPCARRALSYPILHGRPWRNRVRRDGLLRWPGARLADDVGLGSIRDARRIF